MPEQFKALQGFKDILPDEQPYWRMVQRVATEVATLYGYRRIETPVLEETAVFLRTAGVGTDIVEKEMYSFDDRADKEGNRTNLTLRPEGTAGVVRAYLEHGMFQLVQPIKVYYFNEPMFRHDKPQAGRVREHHQFGCEALGDGDPAIDAEMIALLYDFYAYLGLKHIRVFINSIGDGNCRPQYIEILKDYYRPLLAESCQDCQVRFNKNPLRMLDCKEPQDQPKIAAAPKISDYLCGPCREHFDAVQRFLRVYDVPYELDPLIVRGLDYYTRTVFEFTSDIDKLALTGGGRYDGLAEILGGTHIPGIGFGAGIERTILEIKRQKVTPPADERPLAFVVYFGKSPEYKEAAVRTVAALRHNCIKTEMAYGERSAKSQMKQADNSGASFAILIGEKELEGGFVTVKDLQAAGLSTESKQVEVKEEELVGYLKRKREWMGLILETHPLKGLTTQVNDKGDEAMDTLTASNLCPLVNAYTISNGNPKSIMVPQISQLAKLQEVTVSGTLLPKQKITLNPATNQRSITLGAHNGAYTQAEKDGDLHFCFGTQQGDPHIACELQNAAAWLSTFNGAIGQDMTVSGFFRCLFEHPGFRSNDDAHIFEIHPVRAVTLGGALQSFEIDPPTPDSINTWVKPRNLNKSDSRVSVVYDEANDVLTFSGMPGMDENYVSVSGVLSNVQLNADSAAPSSFTLTSPDITNPIQVYCMKGTTAALQLSQLLANGTTSISMIVLRNIDLSRALLGQYIINLLAIDIQAK